MSFQEKYDEYKEREEAKKYFRQNNDQFLDSSQWIKIIAVGGLLSIVLGVIYGLLAANMRIMSSWFYIVVGVIIANVLTKTANVHAKGVGIASVIFTFLTFYFSKLVIISLSFFSYGFDAKIIFSLIPYTFHTMFTDGILDLIFIVMGLFVAYQQAE